MNGVSVSIPAQNGRPYFVVLESALHVLDPLALLLVGVLAQVFFIVVLHLQKVASILVFTFEQHEDLERVSCEVHLSFFYVRADVYKVGVHFLAYQQLSPDVLHHVDLNSDEMVVNRSLRLQPSNHLIVAQVILIQVLRILHVHELAVSG